MSNLAGAVGELAFTVQIKRKETGQIEEYQLIGKITSEQAEELGLVTKENSDGCNTLDHGA